MPSSSPLWRPQLLEFLRRRKKMKKVLSWRITKTLNTSTYLNYLTDVHCFTGFSSGWILDWSVSQSHKWERASWNFTCSSAKITSWKVLSCYEMLWSKHQRCRDCKVACALNINGHILRYCQPEVFMVPNWRTGCTGCTGCTSNLRLVLDS